MKNLEVISYQSTSQNGDIDAPLQLVIMIRGSIIEVACSICLSGVVRREIIKTRKFTFMVHMQDQYWLREEESQV